MTYTIHLPFPPSVNTYWRRNRFGSGMYVSQRGQDYQQAVEAVVLDNWSEHFPLTGRLDVIIDLHPKTRRKFDIDNYAKATIDALMYARMFADDEQIDNLHLQRCEITEKGSAIVYVTEL